MSAEAQSEPPPGPSDPPPWTGPWADDARRLFQLFQTAAESAAAAMAEESAGTTWPLGPADPPGPASYSASSAAPGFDHPPECRYCPFCQGVALLRRGGPEVLDQISEFAAGLAATLRATQPPPQAPPAEPSGAAFTDAASGASAHPAEGGTSAPTRPPSTVRIDVTD
jgi:hypothetical protein